MRKENETKTIYNLDLNEEFYENSRLKIQRVASGWIYKYYIETSAYGKFKLNNTVFVPYDNRFQKT